MMLTPLYRPCPLYEKPSLHSPLFPSSRKCVILGIQNSRSQRSGGAAMTFDDILAQIIALLKRQGRVSYSALKRRFDLDDDYLNDLKDELLYVHPVRDDEGRGLVWTGDAAETTTPPSPPPPPISAPPIQDTPAVQPASPVLTSP